MTVFIFHSFYHRLPFSDSWFSNTHSNNPILESYIFLLFKICLYNSRNQEKVTLRKLIRIFAKVKDIEKESGKKWQNIENMLLTICYLLLTIPFSYYLTSHYHSLEFELSTWATGKTVHQHASSLNRYVRVSQNLFVNINMNKEILKHKMIHWQEGI